MKIEIVAAIIAVGGTIAGALIGHACSRRTSREAIKASNQNAVDIMWSQFRVDSAANLRSAFAPAKAFIYQAKRHGSTHNAPDVNKFLKTEVLRQGAAIERFRPFVAVCNRGAYQDDWEKYRYEVWNYGFAASEINDEETGEVHEYYSGMIDKILSHASIGEK